MSVLPVGLSRVSDLMSANVNEQDINQVQSQLLQVQNELSTGKQVNTPSDNPSAATLIEQLQKTLETRQAYAQNISSASDNLSETDSTLGNLTTLLQQAQTLASSSVGSDVSDSERQSNAAVVQTLLSQSLSLGNTNYNGMYLFGGDTAQTQPFVANASGGITYTGTGKTLQNMYDDGTQFSFQVSGAQVFGALSTGVTGATNLSPNLTASTLLADIGGASDSGFVPGSIQVSNGSDTQTINLSNANTVGDVINDINSAGVGDITASISGSGIQLAGNAGENITVSEVGSGTTGASLGIDTAASGAGAGTPVAGQSLNPEVTALTPLSQLRGGAGLDNSGLIISNGPSTQTITWPPGGTVQDLLNAINGSQLGVRAEINAAGTGINVLNATQGTTLTIGENGGQSATELGLRSFSPSSSLSELNGGQGVQTAGAATPDFQITRRDGTTFQVALGGAQTVQDVINDINTADGGNGVTASFATTGNGIVLTDTTGGSGTLTVTPLNGSNAAAQLGLTAAASGSTLTGSDVQGVQSSGVFADLQALITALQGNNQTGITNAATALQNDYNNVTQIQGQTGAVEQELTSRQSDLDQENVATQSLLSQLQDTNFTDAITQFQTLQTSLQASLETAAKALPLTLLDFLV